MRYDDNNNTRGNGEDDIRFADGQRHSDQGPSPRYNDESNEIIIGGSADDADYDEYARRLERHASKPARRPKIEYEDDGYSSRRDRKHSLKRGRAQENDPDGNFASAENDFIVSAGADDYTGTSDDDIGANSGDAEKAGTDTAQDAGVVFDETAARSDTNDKKEPGTSHKTAARTIERIGPAVSADPDAADDEVIEVISGEEDDTDSAYNDGGDHGADAEEYAAPDSAVEAEEYAPGSDGKSSDIKKVAPIDVGGEISEQVAAIKEEIAGKAAQFKEELSEKTVSAPKPAKDIPLIPDAADETAAAGSEAGIATGIAAAAKKTSGKSPSKVKRIERERDILDELLGDDTDDESDDTGHYDETESGDDISEAAPDVTLPEQLSSGPDSLTSGISAEVYDADYEDEDGGDEEYYEAGEYAEDEDGEPDEDHADGEYIEDEDSGDDKYYEDEEYGEDADEEDNGDEDDGDEDEEYDEEYDGDEDDEDYEEEYDQDGYESVDAGDFFDPEDELDENGLPVPVVKPRDLEPVRRAKAAAAEKSSARDRSGKERRAGLLVSASPHIHCGETTRVLMGDVIIALVPALIASVLWFGWRALMLTGVCVISCVLTEYICRRVMKRRQTINDLSAVVTGIILAFCLPPELNPVLAVIGSVVAIAVVKQMFGGIGMNFANPAATARIVLMLSFPAAMTTWSRPFYYYLDAVSEATPLTRLAEGSGELYSYTELLVGYHGGCIGETCAVALLLGGLYLLLRGVISWEIPLSFMGTVALFSVIAGQDPIYQLLSGGVVLGAIFMATDYVTSPVNSKGRLIFGLGCGLLTMLIRLYSNMPEGVSFAILLMNILTPHIDRLTLSVPFGEEREAA